MIVNKTQAKSIITKSNIPGIDFVINPYIGCQHACIYCYAEFMKRFTGHGGDTWGDFIDVKQYDWDKIKPEKYEDKTILLSSVTDPYTPLEIKYENTRRVLEKLIGTTAKLQILTKSSLVERDIVLFKQFENIQVGISLNSLDEKFTRIIEPRASRPQERLSALKKVAAAGISTYVFVSPIFPKISDWEAIIEAALVITDDFRFENLNFRGHNVPRIMKLISENYPELFDYYKEIRKEPSLWNEMEEDIEDFCKARHLRCRVEFHHGGFTKTKQN
ncbi:MAG: radical SAM protein [Candidatus Thorarchaeota archaeon]|nr:radical SAM protein [Candidatus Thorarchaeota archaeon]